MRISIIIPTLNEAESLPRVLSNLFASDTNIEIVVSDGGSSDGTVAIASRLGARVVEGGAGRGAQLRRGAALSTGEVLLFLHADTRLGRDSLPAIRTALSDPDVIGGNFRLLFDGTGAFSSWLTGFYAWIRARGLYYGDSAIFLRRSTYDVLGGIRPIALMEDYDLTRRMERAGRTTCIQDPAAVTSSRRFENRRPLGIVAQWLTLHGLYALGLSPSVLARLYRSRTHAPGLAKHDQAGVRSSASSFQR